MEKLAEQQQSKYLDLYTILPSEISMQLAEVSLALAAIEDQVRQPSPSQRVRWDLRADAVLHATLGSLQGKGHSEDQRNQGGLQLQNPGHVRKTENHLKQIQREISRCGARQRRGQGGWLSVPGCRCSSCEGLLSSLLRDCLKTWTAAAARSQSWTPPCRTSAAATRCWPNS